MDELTRIKAELQTVTERLLKLAGEIAELSRTAANAAADYEERKNEYLIELYSEEAEGKFKRTEAQRQALYRNAYKRERRAMMLAKNDLDSSRDLFKGVQAAIMSLQTQARMVEATMRLDG